MSWRDEIAPIIAQVLSQCETLTLPEKRKRLREAKPHWVAGASWLNKVWLSECRFQLGLKQRHQPGQVKRIPARGQKDLFE